MYVFMYGCMYIRMYVFMCACVRKNERAIYNIICVYYMNIEYCYVCKCSAISYLFATIIQSESSLLYLTSIYVELY